MKPQSEYPTSALEYDNLVYSCPRCNLIKGKKAVPDPLEIRAALHVDVAGVFHGETADARRLIMILRLNAPRIVQNRKRIIDTIHAIKHDETLLRGWLAFPANLPDLSSEDPPDGNARPDGINESWHAKKKAGFLPSCY